MIETLEADVRSKFQTKKAKEGYEKKQVFELPFDLFNVRYGNDNHEKYIKIISNNLPMLKIVGTSGKMTEA